VPFGADRHEGVTTEIVVWKDGAAGALARNLPLQIS